MTNRDSLANPAKGAAALILALASGGATHAQSLPAPPVSPTPVVKYEYDAEGNPTKSVVAPNTRALTTTHAYDSLARRTTTTDAKTGVVTLGYDLRDELTSVKDPRQLTTSYNVDGLGQLKQLTSPDTAITANTFDAAGNLKTSTDARGALATYSYDALNRLTQIAYSKTGDTTRTKTFTYDQTGTSFGYGVGRLTTAASPDVSTTFEYDALGRVVATRQNAAGRIITVRYDYDAAGRITKITYPSGRFYTYNRVNGQVQSIAKIAGTDTMPLLGQIVYDALGQPVSWTWTLAAPQHTYARVYDTNGRLVRHPLGLLVRDITYDDADRVSRYTHYTAATAQAAPAYDQSFGYDELNRLITVTGSTSWSYSYDANGNRTASAVGITARSYSVSTSSNRLDGVSNPTRSIGYDAIGNTLSDIEAGSSANYTGRYSLEGRLSAMTLGTTAGVEFFYDAMGRRVARSAWTGSSSNPRTVTLFAYDLDNHLIGEYKADGSPLLEYVWLGDTPVAILKLSGADATTYAIHTDHLNTPRVIMDANWQVRWRWMGEPFGVSPAEEQPTANLPALQQGLRFPGQQYEPFGGRHYNHFRDYDPTTGRYVQSDPIGLAAGINTYAYVGGNPVNGIDPLGLECTTANNVTSCSYPGGPSFDVPAQPGFPSPLLGNSIFEHQYDVQRKLEGASLKCVLEKLRNNPTPGDARPATPEGTTNNARVPIIAETNIVKSYLTKDKRTGGQVIVNITGPQSAFGPGYVARVVTDGVVHTYGEGTSYSQSRAIEPFFGAYGRPYSKVATEGLWGLQMQKFIDECTCAK